MKFNSHIEDLKVYEAGKPIELVVREYGVNEKDIIKLASNENPNGTSTKVVEAVKSQAHNMYRYPDDSYFILKDKLAKKFDVKSENIIIGSGSDQIFEFISHGILNKNEKVLVNQITFAMYEIYAKITSATMIKTDSTVHDIEQFKKLYLEHKPKLTYLCTPSNPVGDALSVEEIYSFLEITDRDSMVVVDAAYMEYASYKDSSKGVNVKDMLEKFPNVIYTGTFSKAYGLGGMRTGYGIAGKEIIHSLHKLRPPFNITTLSLVAAIAALEDEEFVEMSIKENFEEMERYVEFAKAKGYEYFESYTNFITIMLGELSSTEVSQKLLERGVIIRNLASYSLNGIRITIGKKEQNDRFFKVFNEIVGS